MDCAAKFKADLAAIPGVAGVELNFGAAKVAIEGDVQLQALMSTGESHQIAIQSVGELPERKLFWRQNPHLLPMLVGSVLTVVGQVAEWIGAEGLALPAYALAILVAGYSTGRKGLRNLRSLTFDMNSLMTIAVAGAMALSEWGEGAVVAVLFRVSEMLEAYTIDRARQSLRQLVEMAPKIARIRRDGGEVELPVEEVVVNDILLVAPGAKLAMDGVVSEGRSAINQAAITGESMPVEKEAGDEVYAGTLNGSGALEIQVTKLVAESTFARIVHLVEEAQAARAPSQTMVDRFARVYTPVVMVIAALIAVAPPLLLNQPWEPWIYRALTLLVVACPCALVVSTPVAILSAISTAARHGVLIKGGNHLERAGAVKVVALDKTGTLTKGEPAVIDLHVVAPDLFEAELVTMAAAVESRSEHPLAKAVLRRAAEMGLSIPAVTQFQATVGRGARAELDGVELFVGSPAYFTVNLGMEIDLAADLMQRWQQEGKSVMLVGDRTHILGAFAFADTPRPATEKALAGLKRAGVSRTVMLTGDHQVTAEAIGRLVGVDEVRAGLLPQDKVAAVRQIQAKHGLVAMVGDGINDAPAMAAASVGVAMGVAGTDVALETADIALMADDLTRLPFAIRLSRSTLAVIRQNIGLALGLKLIAIAAVGPGWLTLWLAILADMGATILVTMNSMRLLRLKPEKL